MENFELDWQSKKTKIIKTRRGKAILKGYILYDSIYTMFSKWQNYSNKESIINKKKKKKKVPSFPLPASFGNSPPTHPSYFIKTHTDTCAPIYTAMHTQVAKHRTVGGILLLGQTLSFSPVGNWIIIRNWKDAFLFGWVLWDWWFLKI